VKIKRLHKVTPWTWPGKKKKKRKKKGCKIPSVRSHPETLKGSDASASFPPPQKKKEKDDRGAMVDDSTCLESARGKKGGGANQSPAVDIQAKKEKEEKALAVLSYYCNRVGKERELGSFAPKGDCKKKGRGRKRVFSVYSARLESDGTKEEPRSST